MRDHQARVLEALQQRLSSQSFFSFRDYMAFILYEPGLGYYQSGLAKLGADGDFMTAPELGPWFANALARQVAQVAERLPSTWTLVELGPGTGRLLADVLDALAALDRLPARVALVDLSAELVDRQQKTLQEAGWLEHCQWWQRLPDQPFPAVVIANEVLDAMPVERLVWEADGVYQLGVAWRDGLVETRRPLPPELASQVAALPPLTGGYFSEINPQLGPWLKGLSAMLVQGLVLLIDYGFPARVYYHPERHQGTLMCHVQHRAHPDPFWAPGCQDVTSHVDFTAVAEAAVAAGFDVAGYIDQAHFLLNLGVGEGMEALDERDYFQAAQAIKRLTMPDEMGELFKVMALTKGLEPGLSGFRGDRRAEL